MDENLKELEALQKENELLKEKNDKLYKDCVSFAKKIKASEDSSARIEELEAEVASLKNEIASLASSDRIREYLGSDVAAEEVEEIEKPFSYKAPMSDTYEEEANPFEIKEPEIKEEPKEVYEDDFGEQTFPTFVPVPEVSEDSIPKNHTTYKKSPFRTFVRVFLWIFLILSMIIGAISLFAYLFSTNYENYAVANFRFASVYNNSLSPAITKDHVILIKYSDFNGIELGSPVVTTKDTRSVATLKSVDVIDGENIATVEDKNGTYKVNENQFLGQVKLSIPYLGKVVQYACANQYNYLAIVVSANLVFLALILLIPSNKAKTPKFGKDYTVEDFTI